MRIQHVDGGPLPTELLDRRHLFAFSKQYTGEQPYEVKILAPAEVCYIYRDYVVLALVAGRLMSTATWNKVPVIMGCTIIPCQRVEDIVS